MLNKYLWQVEFGEFLRSPKFPLDYQLGVAGDFGKNNLIRVVFPPTLLCAPPALL